MPWPRHRCTSGASGAISGCIAARRDHRVLVVVAALVTVLPRAVIMIDDWIDVVAAVVVFATPLPVDFVVVGVVVVGPMVVSLVEVKLVVVTFVMVTAVVDLAVVGLMVAGVARGGRRVVSMVASCSTRRSRPRRLVHGRLSPPAVREGPPGGAPQGRLPALPAPLAVGMGLSLAVVRAMGRLRAEARGSARRRILGPRGQSLHTTIQAAPVGERSWAPRANQALRPRRAAASTVS